ncbi:MAG TPA: AraC family transcriptional regulator, partial [Limnochordia bacterium]
AILSPGELHCECLVEDCDAYTILWMIYDKGRLALKLHRFAPPRPGLVEVGLEAAGDLGPLLAAVWEAATGRGVGAAQTAGRFHLRRLFGWIAGGFWRPPTGRVDPAAWPDPLTLDNAVVRALAFLDGHFPDRLRLRDVAREAHLHPAYLSYHFHRVTGTTIWEYLTELRIQKAKELLLTTGQTLAEIAAQVGYPGPYYLSRAFKRLVGISPQGFRRLADENSIG